MTSNGYQNDRFLRHKLTIEDLTPPATGFAPSRITLPIDEHFRMPDNARVVRIWSVWETEHGHQFTITEFDANGAVGTRYDAPTAVAS